MDEMTVRVPVTVKSKLTEALRTKLLGEIAQNLDRVERDMSQLEFQGKGMLAEQAKVNAQGMIAIRAQLEQKKLQMEQVKSQLTKDKEHLEKLAVGAEIPRGQWERIVTIHVGDDVNHLLAGEILVEDGKVIAFRD